MNPVSPSTMIEDGKLVIFGYGQPEYIPLPASVNPSGLVMTEWELSAEELQCLFTGGRIRLWIWKGVAHVCPHCSTQIPALLSPVRVEAVPAEPIE